jgi:hypothetical protein
MVQHQQAGRKRRQQQHRRMQAERAATTHTQAGEERQRQGFRTVQDWSHASMAHPSFGSRQRDIGCQHCMQPLCTWTVPAALGCQIVDSVACLSLRWLEVQGHSSYISRGREGHVIVMSGWTDGGGDRGRRGVTSKFEACRMAREVCSALEARDEPASLPRSRLVTRLMTRPGNTANLDAESKYVTKKLHTAKRSAQAEAASS